MPRIEDELTGASYNELDGTDKVVMSVDGAARNPILDELLKYFNTALVNEQSGTSYTLLVSDGGKTIDMTNAGANDVIIPLDLDLPVGARIEICRIGGETTVVPEPGVTVDTPNDNLAITTAKSTGVLRKRAANLYLWTCGGSSSGLPQLATPATLTMTADGENAMDFVWEDVSSESGYEVQIAENAGFTTGVQTANKAVGVLTHKFTGLTEGTTYYGRVKAEGDGATYSDSGYAENSADTDDTGLIQLSPVTSFNATVDGSDIDLTWTDTNTSPNEVGYEILRNTTNTTSGATLIQTTAANATSYTDTAPGNGTWFYFIRAKGNLTTTGHSSYVSDSATIAGMDSDAQAYITAEETAGSIDIDSTNENALSALFAGLKTDGLFTDTVSMALGYGTGLKNAKSPGTDDLTGTNLPTISADGYVFDGTNDALSTNIVEFTDMPVKESMTIAIYIKAGTAGAAFGANDGANMTYFFPVSGEVRMQQAGDFNPGANAGATGLYVITLRNDGVNMTRRVLKNGTQTYNTSVAVGTDRRVTTYATHLGALNGSGTLGSFFNGTIGAFMIINRGLTNTEQGNLSTRLQTFITATGRDV